MTNELTELPHNNDSERIILGLLISENEKYFSRIKAENITSQLFFNPIHQTIFFELLKFREQSEALDLVTFTQHLKQSGALEDIGGAGYLTETATGFYLYNWTPHLEALRQLATKREAIKQAERIIQVANSEDAENTLKTASIGLESLRLTHASKHSFKDAERAVKEFVDMLQSQSLGTNLQKGIKTGLEPLDKAIGGLKPNNLIVIGGGTGAGKSVLSLQMANEVMKAGFSVLIYTLELGASEVIQRLVSCHGGVKMADLSDFNKAPKCSREHIAEVTKELSKRTFEIDDTAGISIEHIVSSAEIYSESHEVGLVLVDYVQLVEGTRRQGQSRAEELANTSKQLKQLAKKLRCPVITPSQLNDDGRLRESRAIGQDADIVLSIENIEASTERGRRVEASHGVRVVKNRNGEAGVLLPLTLNGLYQRFEEN